MATPGIIALKALNSPISTNEQARLTSGLKSFLAAERKIELSAADRASLPWGHRAILELSEAHRGAR